MEQAMLEAGNSSVAQTCEECAQYSTAQSVVHRPERVIAQRLTGIKSNPHRKSGTQADCQPCYDADKQAVVQGVTYTLIESGKIPYFLTFACQTTQEGTNKRNYPYKEKG
jgi:hypothetical protein